MDQECQRAVVPSENSYRSSKTGYGLDSELGGATEREKKSQRVGGAEDPLSFPIPPRPPSPWSALRSCQDPAGGGCPEPHHPSPTKRGINFRFVSVGPTQGRCGPGGTEFLSRPPRMRGRGSVRISPG